MKITNNDVDSTVLATLQRAMQVSQTRQEAEKELGLDSHAAMERARALAARVPATVEPDRVLALADHALPDGNAYPLKVTEALLRSNKPFVDKLDAELAWIEQAPLTPAVRRYIALAVDCSYPDRYKQRGDTTNPIERRERSRGFCPER